MSTSTYLSFWTPVQHYTSIVPNATDLIPAEEWYCDDNIEMYFSWGCQVAASIQGREVQLISAPQHRSSCGEILLVLSYLTLIIPAIMLIAKCILRCGIDYTIRARRVIAIQDQPSEGEILDPSLVSAGLHRVFQAYREWKSSRPPSSHSNT